MAAAAAWPVEALRQSLDALLPGCGVEVAAEIDSTNTELMRRARAGRAAPVLLAAERQTAGRGRLGRSWQSAQQAQEPSSLTFSLGLPLTPQDWSGLSLAVGVSVAESLDPTGTGRVAIKWPNDLWVDDRKLVGILVETALPQGDGAGPAAERYVVIGVGVNVGAREVAASGTDAAPRNAPAWVQQWRPGATPQQLLQELASPLLRTVLAFGTQGFGPFAERFAARDALRGREVQLSDGTAGFCEGVGWTGELRVRTAQGLQLVTSSEVSVRPRAMGA